MKFDCCDIYAENGSIQTTLNRMDTPASKHTDTSGGVEVDDLTLVRRCQRGEISAYEVLVKRYQARVYNVVYGIVRNAGDAEELCQEAFVKAWRSLKSFKGDSSFYTWIYRIATNLGIDNKRRSQRHGAVGFDDALKSDDDPVAETLASKEVTPRKHAERGELRAAIEAAIEKLSPEHRAVFVLYELEGMDYKDIARTVGCSIGTVMSRLHYARLNLQKMLKEMR
jgi:RNA polymerase sigma-70 factor (ECF subfamily)